MMKRLLTATAFATIALASYAQKNVNAQLTATDTVGMRVYFYPLDVDSEDKGAMARQADGTLSQEVEESKVGLYNLVCVTGTAQYSLPVYLEDQQNVKLDINLMNQCPAAQVLPSGKSKKDKQAVVGVNTNLDALNSFNALYFRLSREVWTNAANMTEDDLRKMVGEYDSKMKEICGNESVAPAVKEYVKVWAYLLEAEAGSVFNRMNDKKVSVFSGENALLGEPSSVLDSEMSRLHNSAMNVAAQALPKGTLDERLAYIDSHYKNTDMRKGIQRMVLNSFIRNYDYTKGYQTGLDAMLAAQQKYGIDESFVNSFRERISAIPGAAFPDVALIDADGNKVSMAQFRGKYVYIDLWASWCVPCVKEVPYLQKLEEELENKNVVFVSISNDSSEDPWRKKMAQLKMHGNQWLNTDGKLCDKLNVSGIPHFLIYDKEGHLHTYSAPRPSTGSALKKILEELK